ncbi:MAG: hypothetical protein JXB10_10855 [Pirellulales bacterium]|nr:hypothetical protein [Pirellulales bacterium]
MDGAGSKWTYSNNTFIGYSGIGNLNITNGGNVSGKEYVYIGYNSGSTGTVTVDGAGSKWTNSNKLYVGYSGIGYLNITNGGNVPASTDGEYIGYSSGSTGTVTVDGAGSKWTYSDEFYVGYNGVGNLNITNGGYVSGKEYSYIGYNSGSTGTVTIDGSDSKWTNTALRVGYNGKGIITQTGGTISVTGVSLGYYSSGKGTYNLNGGTLILKSLYKGEGTAEFNFGGGTLQAGKDFSSKMPITLTSVNGDANVNTNSYTVTLSGGLSGVGGLNKTGTGTLITSGNYSGNTTITAGTLALRSEYNYNSLSYTPLIDVKYGATFDVSVNTYGFILGGSAAQSLRGNGTVKCRVIAADYGIIEPGESVGILTFTGNLTLNPGARLLFDLAAPEASDKISMPSSTLYLNDQQFADFTFHPLGGFGVGDYLLIDAGAIQGSLGENRSGPIGDYRGTLSTSGNDLILTVVVPEPAAWLLLAPALLGAFLCRLGVRP